MTDGQLALLIVTIGAVGLPCFYELVCLENVLNNILATLREKEPGE